MSNSSYDDLFSLDFIEFKKLVYEQGVDIDEKQLVDSHYNEVLYNYISEKTSTSTCLKIKSFLINFPNYFKFGLKI